MTTSSRSRIFIISHNGRIAARLKALFESDNYQVSVASGGDTVKECLGAKPSVILMDVSRSTLDSALDILRQISLIKDIPAIILSSFSMKGHDSFTSIEFIKKPFNDRELRYAVKYLIARSASGDGAGSTSAIVKKGKTDEPYSPMRVRLSEEEEFKKSLIENTDLLWHYLKHLKASYGDKFYEDLIRNSAETFAIIDEKGEIMFEAPALFRLLGYSPQMLEGRSVFRIVHPEEAMRSRENFRQLLQNPGKPMYNRLRIINQDGVERVLDGIRINLLNDPVVKGIILHYWDVTEREDAVKARAECMEVFEKLAENLSVAVMIVADGKIVFSNIYAEMMTGLSRDELCRMELSDLFMERDRDKVRALSAAGEEGEYSSGMRELQCVTGKGLKRSVSLRCEKLNQKEKPSMLCIMSYVPEGYTRVGALRKAYNALEEKVMLKKEMLLEANRNLQTHISERMNLEQELRKKNKELEDFAYRLSHDLRNNLLILRRLVEHSQLKPEAIEENHQQLLLDTDRLIRFAETLLGLARAGMVIKEKTEVYIPFIISSILEKLYPESEMVEFIYQPAFPPMLWDSMGVTQIFGNLIRNAIDFRDPSKEKLIIELGFSLRTSSVEIWFRDNGLGISGERLESVFDLFCTSKQNENFGFGLPIVKKIILAHGGSVRVTSNGNGAGTAFYMALPFEMLKNMPSG